MASTEKNKEGREAPRRDSGKERLWRRRLEEKRASGLSVGAYCRRGGFSEALFYWWQREIARRDGNFPGADKSTDRREGAGASSAAARARPRFAEVRLAQLSVAACLSAQNPQPLCPPEGRDSRALRVQSPGAPASPREPGAIEIVLRGGRLLRVQAGFDPEALLEVARLLEGEALSC